jgi:hypothetical protein
LPEPAPAIGRSSTSIGTFSPSVTETSRTS